MEILSLLLSFLIFLIHIPIFFAQKKHWQRPILAKSLSSALKGLTSVFGMGTGVSLSISSPMYINYIILFLFCIVL